MASAPPAAPASRRGHRRVQTSAPKRKLRLFTKTDKIVLTLMVVGPLALEAVLIWLPTVLSVGMSFARWDGLGDLSTIKSAGWDNYHYAVTQYPAFWPAVVHNVIWLVFIGLIATPLGILFAVLLDKQIRFTRIYQSIFFLPVMLSLALIGIIWQLMYSTDNGLINGALGINQTHHAINFFGNKSINLWAALVAQTWRHAGYIMILYLAGLKGVDPALRESAALDGASFWQSFRHVIFPVMKPINTVVIVITIIESLRAFDLVYIINHGTNGLELLSALIVQNLLGEGQDLGVGSAIAVVLLVISLIPIIFYLVKTFRKDSA